MNTEKQEEETLTNEQLERLIWVASYKETMRIDRWGMIISGTVAVIGAIVITIQVLTQ